MATFAKKELFIGFEYQLFSLHVPKFGHIKKPVRKYTKDMSNVEVILMKGIKAVERNAFTLHSYLY